MNASPQFMHLTPCLPDEAARLRTLSAYDILDTPAEASFDRLTAVAARVFRTPMAMVTLVDAERQWFKSAVGVSHAENPREFSFCSRAIASDDLMIVPDATLDPRFADNPLVTGPANLRFYAGAPLLVPRFPQVDETVAAAGEVARLGTLCVMDTVPRPGGLTAREKATLQDLAGLVVDVMRQRLATSLHREETAGRQRAERGWRQSEERYQRLSDTALGMIYQFALAPDGSYSFPLVGEGCREVFQLSPAAVRRDANALFDLLDPADRAEMRTSMAQSIATLAPWRWEGRMRTARSGARKWVSASSRPHRQADGTILWDGVLTDESARHAAEEALRELNRELETREAARQTALGDATRERIRAEEAARESRDLAEILVENATDLVFVKDLRGRYLLANPALARTFGKRAEEIVGRDARTLFNEATAREVAEHERTVAATGATTVKDFPAVMADGRTVRLFQIALTPMKDHAGSVAGIVGIARDVTERQGAERRVQARACQQAAVARLGRRALELGGASGLRTLLSEATELVAETLPVPFCTFIHRDPEQGTMRHHAVFGWPKEVIGQPISNSGDEGSGSAFILREGGVIACEDLREETRFVPSPDSRRYGLRGAMAVIVARRTDGPAEGEAACLGVLSVHDRDVRRWTPEDVTFLQAIANVLAAAIDRRRAEEAVETARREAERANLAKSEFLSRMSHELRTPLNAILGFGQLLELDAGTAEQGESVAHILRAGRHLLGLIDEVLDIARLESGRLVLEPAPVNVREMTEEALSLVRHAARTRGVSLEPPDLRENEGRERELCAWADPTRLRQVIVHFLTNAVKYNVPGGRVGLRSAPAQAGAAVRIEVWDSGRGIPAEQHERLFRPFERLGTEHDPSEGTGIGLAVAKRLVEAMGGSIGVRSAPGEGSTFWVEVPAGEGEMTKDE